MRAQSSSTKIDFSKGPVWKCIVAEPISNVMGSIACYLTMRMTIYRKLEKEEYNGTLGRL